MQDIAAKHGVQPARSIMVGDRLDTDVLWGLNTGMATLLVMTGRLVVSLHSGDIIGHRNSRKGGVTGLKSPVNWPTVFLQAEATGCNECVERDLQTTPALLGRL